MDEYCGKAYGTTSAAPQESGHQAIETLFLAALAAAENGRFNQAAKALAVAERALLDHFALEESGSLADLLLARPREGRAVVEEHGYLRKRLTQIRSSLPGLPIGELRTFIDELSANGRHEERVLYRRGAQSPGDRTPEGTSSD